ncbi:MAG: metallophosphoesterase [Chitinophagaceae bacterium]
MQRWWKWTAWGASALGGYVLLHALFVEQYFFRIKKYSIGKKGGQKKVKLLLLTDLHLKNSYRPYYARLVRTINRLQPHLILISGDMLDAGGDVKLLEKFLSNIKWSIPKAAILGNHDHANDARNGDIAALLKQYNGQLLVNRSHAFTLQGERIVITGLDDFIESNHDLIKAVENMGKETHHLLLLHSPLQQLMALKDIATENRRRPPHDQLNISYIFAGHNHGGQVRFRSYAPVRPMMSGHYLNGWYNNEAPFLYVSKGFGTSRFPIRFGARAEVTLFDYYV